MFAPVLLFYVIFKYVPMFGIIIAFKHYNFADGVLHSPWAGLDYFKMLFQNPQAINVIRNTFLIGSISLIVGFPFPIIVAIMLNELRRMWFKRTVQTLIYLPHFLSWVIVGGIVVTFFAQESGIINHYVKLITGDVYPFLYKHVSWMFIFLGSGIWKEAGFGAIIYLAALTAIDPSLYESASIDGASKWRQIVNITLPGIAPTIVVMMILNIGHVLEVGFDKVYVLQNPVVENMTDVISTFIYRVGIQGAQFSFTSAIGLFESVVGFTLVYFANRTARRFGHGFW
ncbi:MAG: sugar transporter permease [Paenibacillus sp.]|nr:sugar transporter permease [Paenibacillus sp.]